MESVRTLYIERTRYDPMQATALPATGPPQPAEQRSLAGPLQPRICADLPPGARQEAPRCQLAGRPAGAYRGGGVGVADSEGSARSASTHGLDLAEDGTHGLSEQPPAKRCKASGGSSFKILTRG